jgi:type I restriction-modification system DNA methylase subunit
MSSPNLRNVRNFDSLIRYLEDELGWPLDGYEMEDLTFDYDPSDLGLKEEEAAKVKSIRQLRPLTSSQPWGIFFIEFDKKQLPVVVLRRILSHLVLKKRASANAADAKRWSAQDLLFVSAFGPEDADGREIGFAHFHEESGDLPSLRVLGWDGDNTALTLQRVASTLKERLRWPEKGETVDAWRQRWSGAFKHRPGHIIRTSDLLAEALAALAKRIRDAARTLMEHETERGPLRTLHKAFQTNLIHDLDENGFADTYAQTITYGLLTAAINRTDMTGGRHGTFVKADDVALAIKPTSPFLKEMLETFLKVGGRRGHMDFDELGVQDVVELLRSDVTDIPAILADFGNKTRGEDPVIHFYEHFLSAYNKELKIKRGVFYTPQPVVGSIVRSVHELLQTEFDLEDGLASTITWGEIIQKNPSLQLPLRVEGNPAQGNISENEPFVQILDPATGTATFLVETIEVIHRTLKAKWQSQRLSAAQQRDAWNEYVPKHLLPRLHGYELMMAPYAIAHMKIGLKLTETGYRFDSEERARVYLTNALEPWRQQLPLIGFEALAHEAAAVNEIKRAKRFTVVIGNPPYSKEAQNLGAQFLPLIEPFRFFSNERIREPGAILFERDINNDYVKFFGFYRLLIESANVGILGVITSSSYLDGKNFRGVRDAIAATFDEISVLNLHGDSRSGALAPRRHY